VLRISAWNSSMSTAREGTSKPKLARSAAPCAADRKQNAPGSLSTIAAAPHVSGLDASADGMWVIATRDGRVPHVVMRPGTVGDLGPLPQAPEGIIAAAW
jgi:hypothetical protein